MGSIEKPRISKATLDKKADSSLVSILKQSFNQLEIENKELQNRLDVGINLYKELKEENKELKEEIEELKEYRKIDLEELKNFEEERFSILTECVKLKNLVEKLRDAIEEPKELDDK